MPLPFSSACALESTTSGAGLTGDGSPTPAAASWITLSGPIGYRAPGEHALATLPDVGAAAVSARQLVLLTVSYVLPERAAEQEPGRSLHSSGDSATADRSSRRKATCRG